MARWERFEGKLGRGTLALGLLAGALLHCPLEARADDASQAQFHYELASEHYAAGRNNEAIREFFIVQRLAPNPRVLYNIGLCFEQLSDACSRRRRADCDGDIQQAYHWYSVYRASDDTDEDRRRLSAEALTRLQHSVALVRVESDPPGADILVDRRDLGSFGQTPRVLPLEPGAHTITLEQDGHRSVELQVEVTRGQEVTVRGALEPILGTLRVHAPEQSAVRVSSSDRTVAEGTSPFEATLAPGGYQVEVVSPGSETWRGLATVRADEATMLEASPVALPAPTADLTVTANVAGAVVELDGEAAGFTPTILSDVATGEHALVLRHPGLQPMTHTLELGADERGWLTATLEPPPVVTRSPATWVLGGLGAASLIAAAGVAGRSFGVRQDYDQADDGEDLGPLRDQGQRLNLAADVLLATGLVSLVVGVVLYFTTERTVNRESAAVFSREER